MIQRGRLVAWGAFVAAFSALSYASRFLVDESKDEMKDILYTYEAAIGGVVQYAIILAIILLIARGDQRSLLALRRPSSWPAALGLSFLVLVGVLVLAGLLEPFLRAGEEQGLLPEDWDPARADAFVANFIVVAGVAAIVEELTFRGLGYSLLEPLGRWQAILIVGVTFGLAHGLVVALPVLSAFGAGLAYLRSRTGSVYPGIILHGLFNALALTFAVAS